MTFDCFRFRSQGAVVEVARRTELPLARRRWRSILELHLGDPRVGRKIERPSYVHYPWCGILAWFSIFTYRARLAIFCIGNELLYFVYGTSFHFGMSCHILYMIGNFCILIYHFVLLYSSTLQLMRLQYLLLTKQ